MSDRYIRTMEDVAEAAVAYYDRLAGLPEDLRCALVRDWQRAIAQPDASVFLFRNPKMGRATLPIDDTARPTAEQD